MNKLSLPVVRNLKLRWMVQRDLPRVLQIEQQTPAPQWTGQDFLTVFQSGETASWVAEIGNRVVGFVVYTVAPRPESPNTVEVSEPAYGWEKGEPTPKPLVITLLNIAVAPEWRRRGIGRTLLERLEQKLRQTNDCIQVTVAESNLPVQLFLRNSGYKALRVLRDYYDSEDGYLMEQLRD